MAGKVLNFLKRRPTNERRPGDGGPPCDRCGEATGKPGLYRDPASWWRCDPCEQKVTRIIFETAAAGISIEPLLHYTGRPGAGQPPKG